MGDIAPLGRCEASAMRRTQRFSRAFGVDAAADDPLIRPPRSLRKQRASAANVGAVSAVSVLALVLSCALEFASGRE